MCRTLWYCRRPPNAIFGLLHSRSRGLLHISTLAHALVLRGKERSQFEGFRMPGMHRSSGALL